ncbi:MAG: hypothetical protein ACYSVY_00110 [Planctomycetota bacterium]
MMLALIVKQGTTVQCIKKGKEWYTENFIKHETTKDVMFFREDIRVDPVGKLSTAATRYHKATIGGAYASGGWYGFERDGWYMLVPMDKVECH